MRGRNDKEITVDIKWDEEFVADGECKEGEGVPEKILWNTKTPRKGAGTIWYRVARNRGRTSRYRRRNGRFIIARIVIST